MPHDFVRSRRVADAQIQKWGRPAVLRHRTLGDQKCWVYISAYSPVERAGRMIDPVDSMAIVSPIERESENLIREPDRENDTLVTFAKGSITVELDKFRISAPPDKLEPADEIVYYELRIRK